MSVVATVESDFSLRKLKIAGICLMGQIFGTNMLMIGPLSMMMVDMTKEFGWSRSQFSGSTTAVMWAGALAYPLVGRLIDRRGVRPVVVIGAIALGLLSIALGYQTASLGRFYLLYALVGVFGAIAVGYGKVLGSLFTQHRGKGLALVGAVSPIIASIFPQTSLKLLQAFSWRGIYIGYGITTLVAAVLLYFFLEEPAGSAASAAIPSSSAGDDAQKPAFTPPKMEGLTAAEALRGKTLWIMIGSGLAAGILGGGWAQHSYAFQLSRGFDPQVAVNALTVSLLIAPVVVMFGGWLADKVQTAMIFIPFALAAALSIYLQSIAWANYGGIPLLFGAITLSTIAINAQMPMASYFYTRFFGMKAFGEIFGINMAVLSLVSGFSAPLIGSLYDHRKSYDLALLGMIAGYVLAGLLYLGIGRYRYTTDFKTITAPEKAVANTE